MNRIERLAAALPQDTDGAIITSDINRRYFTGMKSSAGTLVIFREKAYLIIDFRYIEKASAVVKSAEVILQGRLFEQINELIERHGAKVMSIESESMTVSVLRRYEESLKCEIDSSNDLSSKITELREVKDEDEIAACIKAQRIAEEAFTHILGFIREGVTEREIGLELDYYMLSHGAEALSFDTIALSGVNTSMPHGVPSDKKVEKGEFVLMDYGAVYDGYHSDMTRTVCVGEPSEEMRRVYDIVLKAQCSALSAAAVGMPGIEVDKVARDIIAAEGYGEAFGHSLGHGVGMEIHESPTAAPRSEGKLRENTILTFEPGIYLAGKFGVRIEDFGVIRANGVENMTLAPKNLIIL